MTKKIIELVETAEDIWINTKVPADLKTRVMDNLPDLPVQPSWMQVLKYASMAILGVSLVVSSLLWIRFSHIERVVIMYPYHGEESVELLGSFNDWQHRVEMNLDEKTAMWHIELVLQKGKIYEYQFLVDKMIYTTGNAEHTVVDRNDQEKALLFL